MKILQELSDNELKMVCSVNKYVSSLCNEDTFWLNRLLKTFTVKTIKQLKGDFSYKQIYKYLFYEQNVGILNSIKNHNFYLFKTIYEQYSNKIEEVEVLLEATDTEDFEILSFLLFQHEDMNDRDDAVDVIISLHNEKIFEWLNKMSLCNKYRYVVDIIIDLDSYEDHENLISQIKKYSEDLEELQLFQIAFILGETATNRTIKAVKTIYQYILSNIPKTLKSRNDLRKDFISGLKENTRLTETEKEDLVTFVNSF